MAGNIQVTWHGVPEWNAAMEKLVAEASRACERGANNAARLVATETKKTLTRTTHRKGTPTPSRPGEPPSLVTGTLRRGVIIVPAEPSGTTSWTAKVGPTSVYARVQELGGDTGRMVLPARPYLGPTVARLIGDGSLWGAFASGLEQF